MTRHTVLITRSRNTPQAFLLPPPHKVPLQHLHEIGREVGAATGAGWPISCIVPLGEQVFQVVFERVRVDGTWLGQALDYEVLDHASRPIDATVGYLETFLEQPPPPSPTARSLALAEAKAAFVELWQSDFVEPLPLPPTPDEAWGESHGSPPTGDLDESPVGGPRSRRPRRVAAQRTAGLGVARSGHANGRRSWAYVVAGAVVVALLVVVLVRAWAR